MQDSLFHRHKREWITINVEVPSGASEWASAFMIRRTGNGVETKPGQRHDRETIIAYADGNRRQDIPKLLSEFQAAYEKFYPDLDPPAVQENILAEEDWGSKWKEHFRPFHVSRGLVIKPTWEDYRRADDEHVINIDPGLAFGTGHHDSTRFALQLMEEAFRFSPPPERILDVGCGTGILAIAASVLGARRVTAIDNDIDALTATRENILRNPSAQGITVSSASISAIDQEFNLIVANIVHDVLCSMLQDFRRMLSCHGYLVLAGILRGDQEKNILDLYSSSNFELLHSRHSEEWAALLFRRNP